MRQIKKGSTDISVDLYIIDSTDGTPETGVLWNTSGIDLKYRRELEAEVSITEASLVGLTSAHTDGGFLEIGYGSYRLDIPDAAIATSADKVTIFGTVTGMIVLPVEIQLVDFDPEDSTRLGLTALPNANADAAGGLPISDAGGLDIDTKLANANEITASRMATLTDWIDGGRLDLILDIIAADVVNIDGAAMRGTDSANTVIPDPAGTAPTAIEINDALVAAHGSGSWLTNSLVATDIVTNGAINTLSGAVINVDTVDTLTTYTGNTVQTGDSYSRLGLGGIGLTNLGGMSTSMQAEVNAEIDTALVTTTYTEPGQGAPSATASIKDKLGYMYKFARNKITNDGINVKVWDDAGTTIDQLSPVTSVGGTVTRGEFISG